MERERGEGGKNIKNPLTTLTETPKVKMERKKKKRKRKRV